MTRVRPRTTDRHRLHHSSDTKDFALNDYYQDLGVARDASPEDIKRAYRKKARHAAPGRQPQPGGRGAVQEGLAGLRRALRRGQAPLATTWASDPYAGGAAGFGQGFSFSDIMDAFFGGGAGQAQRGPRSRQRRGQDALDPARHRPRGRGLRRREGARHRDRRGLRRPVTATAPSRAPRGAPATSVAVAARSSRCSARSSARS